MDSTVCPVFSVPVPTYFYCLLDMFLLIRIDLHGAANKIFVVVVIICDLYQILFFLKIVYKTRVNFSYLGMKGLYIFRIISED